MSASEPIVVSLQRPFPTARRTLRTSGSAFGGNLRSRCLLTVCTGCNPCRPGVTNVNVGCCSTVSTRDRGDQSGVNGLSAQSRIRSTSSKSSVITSLE